MVRKIKRTFSLVLSFVMLAGGTVQAEETKDEPIDTTANTYLLSEEEREGKTSDEIVELERANEENATQKAYEMKIATNALKSWPAGPATYGEAGIIMEAKSGAILYAKNIDGKAYPASITKILTALIALENARPEDKITITDASIDFLEYGDAHIGMTPGEEITLNDALYALLLASANEVAYAIADNVGESYDWFLNEMNRRAKELGAVNSNFANTNGLTDVNHYTTARDMALITQELLENHEEFKTISQTLQYTIAPTNLVNESRTFQQVHQMFYDWNDYYYPNAGAGKTGYTDEAMNTLVTCADDGNLELICVVLKTHGRNVYTDSISLLEYGFQNFRKVDIGENETSEDFGVIEKDAYVVIPEGVDFKDLKSTVVSNNADKTKGTVTYTWEENPVGSAEITFSDSYLEKNKIQIDFKKETEKTEKKSTDWKKMILISVLILIALLGGWMAFAAVVRKKRREERRRRRRREAQRRRRIRQQEEERRRENECRRR